MTKRALAWLATLSREAPLPTAAVERLIVAAGSAPHRAWLDFHEAYAGYVEQIGPDEIAVWGLARAASAALPPMWLPPDTVNIVVADHGFPEAIQCADVHPVHGYEIGSDGAFRGIGGPAASFEMKIERHGVMKEFYDGGPVKQTLLTHRAGDPPHQALIQEMAPALVVEASDEGSKVYLEPMRLLRFNPFIHQLVLLERA